MAAEIARIGDQKRAEERLENLRKITARLARFGMRVFFYLNEPRSMPPEFFRGREAMRASESQWRDYVKAMSLVLRES